MKLSLRIILFFIIIVLGAFLRCNQIDTVPHGLYLDEVSIGYNAYSVLTTGKDEHGEQSPLFFRAFGEYKLPVYIYLTAGAMELFGKNDIAVRIPSALFGTATIVVLYYFVLGLFAIGKTKFFEKNISTTTIALMSAFLLAVSPWHIHFSRAGFEANVALFFYLLGCTLALYFLKNKRMGFLMLASMSFVVALYTYNTYRFIVPITALVLLGSLFIKHPQLRKQLFVPALTLVVFSIPMILFSFSSGGAARFAETSAFTEYKAETMVDKAAVYPAVFVKNYASYFSLDFLFSYGDRNGRHQLPGMGLFFRWELPFFLIGLFYLLRQKNKKISYIIVGLLLLAPIIPAFTRPSPHSLRALLMVVPITLIISIGILSSFYYLSRLRKPLLVVVILIFIYEYSLYIHSYYEHYPNVNALDWGSGYKAMVLKAQYYQKGYEHIVIEHKLGDAPLYARFYAPELKVTYAAPDWEKPESWNGKKVLLIRTFYGDRNEKKSIDQVYLPGPNKDIFAQFWKL